MGADDAPATPNNKVDASIILDTGTVIHFFIEQTPLCLKVLYSHGVHLLLTYHPLITATSLLHVTS